MQRYFAINKKLELDDGDYYHIKKVMRMNIGDIIEIVYDEIVYECFLTSINNVKYEIIKKTKNTYNGPKILVAFSMLKEQKLDYLLQKATEVGAFEFFPLITKRSIIKFDNDKENNKISRWQKICKEASEQSNRNYVPIVNKCSDIKKIASVKCDLKLLFTVNEKTKNIKKVLQNNSNYDTILIVIGPEGGFEESEEEYLINNGFISTSLGSNVFRAETAPVAAISMINYEFLR